MSIKLVVGNWKMNGRLAVNESLLREMLPQLPNGVDVAVCVPFPYLTQVGGLVSDASVALGAQDVSQFDDGAFTGQVSAQMLKDVGCRYVIVGHSERRSLCGEVDEVVAQKAAISLACGLIPIFCIGETLAERDLGEVEAVLGRQLDALENVFSADELVRVVVAYEPVWAIGSGLAATPEQIEAVLVFIRAWFAERTDVDARVRVLYGGSVKADSAGWLFGLEDSDGVLVGGASLLADEFVAICRAAAAAPQMV